MTLWHVRLSIPLWFDWGQHLPGVDEHDIALSIPLWFDWGR